MTQRGARASTGLLALIILCGAVPGIAQVVHESGTESHTGTTGSASEDFFDISVPFTSDTKGLLVFTYNSSAATATVTAVTIDPGGANTNVPAVSGGEATDSADEPGNCKAWFLGSNLPTTTTTVRITRTNNAEILYAVAITVTAGGNTEIYTAGIVLLNDDGALSEQSVDDGSPGVNSVRYAGAYYGGGAVPSLGASSSEVHNIDLGARGARAVRETTAGQGARSVGFSDVSDDRAAVHLAIREIVTATPRRGALLGILP